ncbi:hypothetical protein Z043_100851 [Scleropages formosus]|uniref:Ig-like domain-containing protein n=1 Tax=Scleropages formosus TaxID=113540 RepID=A0A0P7ZEP0_SCLFO|nr:hypothetical protein Z043_100851 [Scleropages formosus]
MYWFRQRPGQALKLVVYSYVQMENMEEEFKSRFSAKHIDTSLSLTLHHLQVADSAIQGKDKSAEMTCEHTDSSYYQMYWFRQLPGQNMELVVFSDAYGTPDFGNFSELKYGVQHSVPETGTFTVKAPEAGDSGVYYCAAGKHEPDMIRTVFSIAVILAGQGEGSDVMQSPEILWTQPGKNAEMTCNHKKGVDYLQMYWYRQRPGENIELMVFTASGMKADLGKLSEDKYAANKNTVEDGFFTVKNVEAGDSGEYFCAVSKHSAADRLLKLLIPSGVMAGRGLAWWGARGTPRARAPDPPKSRTQSNSLRYRTHHGQTVKQKQSDTEGNDVTQAPRIIWKSQGENATMSCSHNKGSLYSQMYWYRQRPGESIELVVFTAVGSDPDFGTFNKEKFDVVKTVAESGSFTMKDLEPGDNGVYFCAVSQHSATG